MRKRLRDVRRLSKEEYEKKSQESKSATLGEVLFGAWQEESFQEPPYGVFCRRGISLKIEKNGKKNCRGKCEEVHTDQGETRDVQEKESNVIRRKVTSKSQRTDAMQRPQLTRCCKPGPN